MGIPAAEHARIFEPFYRAPDVVAAQIQGAGLGLSLVQRIVEAHGGRIALRSAPGAGSEFTVAPADCGDRSRPSARACSRRIDARAHPVARVKRLLLVEDEPGLVMTLTDRLDARGLRGRDAAPTARAASSARRARRSTCCSST